MVRSGPPIDARSCCMSNRHYYGRNDADELRAALGSNKLLGIDTEFMRESTFFAELCLVQIATADAVLFLDPLADTETDLPMDALLERDWVVHSGRQDLEVVFQATGRMPAGVFDTQIACGMLGYPPQLGYANMVQELFGVELSKSHTRADWRARPLSEEVLTYAAEDVEFLLAAEDALRNRLAELGRADWAREDSRALQAPELYSIDPEAAVKRLKAARNLRGKARRAAAALAAWRERYAISANRPRGWILKDSLLIDIVRTRPLTIDDLAALKGMPNAVVRRSGAEILDTMRAAEHGTDDYRPPQAPSESEKAALKAMQKTVASVSEELGIAAEILAPRKELSAVLRGERQCRVFSGWRQQIIGEKLAALLE